MFNPLIRIVLIVSSFAMSILFYSNEDFKNMGLILIAVVLIVYGYYKYGTVYLAFQEIKKNNYKKAEKLIAKINKPNNLTKGHKSYYHFTKGIIASDKKEWDQGYIELTKALEIGLRTKNDTSIVLLNLAYIEFERKKIIEAKFFLKKLKEFELKSLIKKEADKLIKKINVVQDNL